MKMKYIILSVLAGMLFLVSSCEKESVPAYSDIPRLFFYDGPDDYATGDRPQHDSIVQTFFFIMEDIKKDTVWVNVKTMGFPSDEDRPIKLRQIETDKPDAAKPGVHYVGFDDAELQKHLVIPKGKVGALIPVVLLRHKDMVEKLFRVNFEIAPNDYFQVGVTESSKFMVTTSDKAEPPKMWDSWWRYAFGTYGDAKLRFIVQVVGFRDMDERSSTGFRTSMQIIARQKLEEYNEMLGKDGPLKEADGTVVTI